MIPDAAQDSRRPNAFGFLRLLFASLVIVAHTPELVDGDRHREILSRAGGTISFGELAVSGFFIISGFLITKSFMSSPSVRSYLLKRVGRIYPAFVVASLVCLLIVAPLAGGTVQTGPVRAVAAAAARVAILARPMVDNAFAGQHYADRGAALDGVMWTIQYEFACYLLVIVLGSLGWLRRPAVLVLLALALLAAAQWMPQAILTRYGPDMLFPAPVRALFVLPAMFVSGAAFRALSDHIRFDSWMIAVAVLGLGTTLLVAPLTNLGVAGFGSYLIFAAARKGGNTWLARVNDRNDISYGLYLYAWPVQRLLMLCGLTSLLPLGLATWMIAALLGLLSWLLVERPAMKWVHRLAGARGPARRA